MPIKKRTLTPYPTPAQPRRIFVLHPMSIPKDADGYCGRSHVWVLSVYGSPAIVACYEDKRREAVAAASAMLSRAAVLGQRSELRVRLSNGRFGEARTFPRSSDPRRSRG